MQKNIFPVVISAKPASGPLNVTGREQFRNIEYVCMLFLFLVLSVTGNTPLSHNVLKRNLLSKFLNLNTGLVPIDSLNTLNCACVPFGCLSYIIIARQVKCCTPADAGTLGLIFMFNCIDVTVISFPIRSNISEP